MSSHLVILRAAMTRGGEIALDRDFGMGELATTTLRTATNVTAMVVGICLVLLGLVVLTTAIQG